jgi:hypothetical protein
MTGVLPEILIPQLYDETLHSRMYRIKLFSIFLVTEIVHIF